jgi:hypothetical protein
VTLTPSITPTDSPKTPGSPNSCNNYCVILRKFHDVNGNGLSDLGEAALSGVHFEFAEGGRLHRRITDKQGAATFCMDSAQTITVRELGRESGGQWQLTTVLPAFYTLTCPARELWIGNQEVGLPKTGMAARGMSPIGCSGSLLR